MSVVIGVLSGIGLCDGLITRPEESYRLWCVVVCDLETPRMRRPCSTLGRSATRGKKIFLQSVMLICYARCQFFFPYFHKKNNKQPYYKVPSIPLQLTTSGQIELSKDSKFHFHCVSRGFITTVLPV